VVVPRGAVVGVDRGPRAPHAVALDESGQFGYVSDGGANDIKVFDRRTFEVTAAIPLDSSPRALAFEPQTGLLFAVSAGPAGAPPPTADARTLRQFALGQWRQQEREANIASAGARPHEPPANPCSASSRDPRSLPAWESNLILIDPEARSVTAEMRICGYAGFAAAGGDGSVYATLVSGDRILRIDAAAVLNLAESARQSRSSSDLVPLHGSLTGATLRLDWRNGIGGGHGIFSSLGLGADCHTPRALAVDSKDSRIFAACNNLKMAVLNAANGQLVATLPIGPDPDAVGYDADRGLIFSANGGAQGSLTVIRRDGSDSYNVVQTLPTRQQARTLAVNSSAGQVYLVTVIQVAQLGTPPRNGIGTLKLAPQDSSFQVLVVGN
jgi:DNA-binding beta-propeller fold protein YncE